MKKLSFTENSYVNDIFIVGKYMCFEKLIKSFCMKYKLQLCIYFFFLFFLTSFKAIDTSTSKKFKLPKGVTAKDYIPGKLIIKYKNFQSPSLKTLGNGVREQKFPVKILSERPFLKQSMVKSLGVREQNKIDEIGLNRVYEITFEAEESIETVINKVLEDPSIEYAEPSYIYHTYATPNDPDYLAGRQSYLSQVKSQEAWNIQPNANGVVIAIVDSGSDLDHQDLAANIYLNTADPINGIDDDADGYLDNYRGWDFVGASASNLIEDNNPDIPADSLDHGVHVSGIASAVTNNGIGVASIAQTAKLMILKVGSDDNSTAIYRGYDGIFYAATRGVKIINCSWGGPGGGALGQDVIDFAVSKGCLVVVAAGNSGNDDLEYPAAFRGAFAVANLNSSSMKSSSSTYGYHVEIAAPGSGIYNTINNNNYGFKSGTSMATPLVSSAAALVAAKYPALTGVQVGELLRLGSDDINNLNPSFRDKLGKGRLNVFKALTINNTPAIRNQNTNINDPSGSLAAGDTIEISFNLMNILQSANDVQVNLSSTATEIEILNPTISVGQFLTSETKVVGPFKVYVKPNTSINKDVVFKISYSSSSASYQDFEFFILPINLDYQNITVNQISTTITSNGRIGYSSYNAENGLGFIYKNNSLLFEASLMIGNSSTRVSNNARSSDGDADEHFVRKTIVTRVLNSEADYEGFSEFVDSNSPLPLNIEVKHTIRAFKDAPDDKYVIADYEIKNTGTVTLNNVYVGLFTDWDISESSKNITKYNSGLRLGYTYATDNMLAPYAGVKVLNTDISPLYYPMSLSNGILEDDSFSIADKYKTLSNGVFANSLGEANDGLDVMYVIGAGNFSIPVNGSVKVSYALIGGDNLADIEASAVQAQEMYTQLVEDGNISDKFILSQNYPNPVINNNTTIEVFIPDEGNLNLRLFDLAGRQMRILADNNYSKGKYSFSLNTSTLFPGIYYCNAIYKGKQQTIKIVVIR